MITSKQRSFLKSMAHSIDPVVYIGKAGVTDNVIKEIDTCLEIRELVKVKLQEGCDLKPKEYPGSTGGQGKGRSGERLHDEKLVRHGADRAGCPL